MRFPWFGYNQDDAQTALRVVGMLNELREGDGASVTLMCQNSDADHRNELEAVEVCDDWTNWCTRRFYGKTVEAALVAAVTLKRRSV